jgi:K+-transporting ATPase ATPase C chain
MLNQVRPALAALASLTLVTGLAYPLAMTGLAQTVASAPANGSLVRQNGQVVGSRLIGQTFTKDYYLQGRPSAAGDGYDPTQSGGSNLGPLDPKLSDRVAKSVAAIDAPAHRVPADAVTTSASGLDPDISPEFAALQAARIAKARQVETSAVQAVIDQSTEGRLLGVIGEPRVNVLAANLALDQRFGRMSKPK